MISSAGSIDPARPGSETCPPGPKHTQLPATSQGLSGSAILSVSPSAGLEPSHFRQAMRTAVLATLLATLPVLSESAAALPPAVWPAPRSARCTPGAGPALVKALALPLSGPGARSAIAINATARYRPLLTAGSGASGGVGAVAI
eukprot:COSAG04_NODE_12326_length_658_cov_1.230769_2_plen_144_part_01